MTCQLFFCMSQNTPKWLEHPLGLSAARRSCNETSTHLGSLSFRTKSLRRICPAYKNNKGMVDRGQLGLPSPPVNLAPQKPVTRSDLKIVRII